MTSAQIKRVLNLYTQKLEELAKTPLSVNRKDKTAVGMAEELVTQRTYLEGMISRFPDVLKDREKAMRWLCFMQGVFWSHGEYTVDELKTHNADPATKTDVARLYHNHTLNRYATCAACGDLDGCHKWREYDEAKE